MTENLIIIETLPELNALISKLETLDVDTEFMAFDTETTGLEKDSEIVGYSLAWTVDTAYYVITRRWITINAKKGDRRLFSDKELIDRSDYLLELLKKFRLIGQNFGFDAEKVEVHHKIELMPSLHTDTQELWHLLDENNSCGLKQVGFREFGEDATKESTAMKESVVANGGIYNETKGGTKEMYKADPHILAEYGAKDAILTLKVFYRGIDKLVEENLVDFFYEESMPLLKGPTYQMNTTGLKMDVQKLLDLERELTNDCGRLKAEIEQEIAKHTKKLKPKGFGKKKDQFNIGSSSQMAWLLFLELGNDWKQLTDKGRDVCKDLCGRLPYTAQARRAFVQACKDTNDKKRAPNKLIKCDKETLTSLAKKYTWVQKLLYYKAYGKLLSTYVKGIQAKLRYGVINPSFLQHGTTSGRYSCIAEGTMISMPGGDKPIEQVNPGDLVFCFTSDGKPTVAPVLDTMSNGLRDCIQFDWRSQGSHETGSLVCTPEHRIKTRENIWKRADSLVVDERVYHLRRAKQEVNGRHRIYGPDYFMENECQLIKREFFGVPSHYHIHHKDENKGNNNINNLEVMTASDHVRLHGLQAATEGKIKYEHLRNYAPKRLRGEESLNWIRLSRFTAIRKLAQAKGKLTSVDMDFDTLPDFNIGTPGQYSRS